MGYAPQAPAKKKGHKVRNGLIVFGVLVVAVIGISMAGSGATKSTSNSQASSQPSTQAQASASHAPAAVAPAKPKFITFGSGTLVVGKDVQPGTYRTRHDSSNCYFARLSGFGGTLDEIIANENSDARLVVTILATDKGFQSSNCDTWSSDLSAINTSKTSFGAGDMIVGTDMQPGTYQNTASSNCYYARVSGFGHTLDEIIANDNTDAQAVVTIAATDKGFGSDRCGTWTKIA